MSGAAYYSLVAQAEHAAQMLEELSCDHTSSLLRDRIAAAKMDMADQLTADHKLLLLMAAERFLAETERSMVACASMKTQTVLEQQAQQLRLARAWLERQETKL
jgi:hypothetical protein